MILHNVTGFKLLQRLGTCRKTKTFRQRLLPYRNELPWYVYSILSGCVAQDALVCKACDLVFGRNLQRYNADCLVTSCHTCTCWSGVAFEALAPS